MVRKYPCLSCRKAVKSNQNAVMCINCHQWIHLVCSSLDYDFFQSDKDFVCSKCLMTELPFILNDEEVLTRTSMDSDAYNTDNSFQYGSCETVLQNLKSLKGLKVGHLNVCSILKNFEEIQGILNDNYFDIFALCETRLS